MKSRKPLGAKQRKVRYEKDQPKALFVAEPVATYGSPPAIARVFQSGNSQAVRLPRAFRVKASELFIFRRGEEIVLRERPLKLSSLLAGIPALPDDFPDAIPDAPPEPADDLP